VYGPLTSDIFLNEEGFGFALNNEVNRIQFYSLVNSFPQRFKKFTPFDQEMTDVSRGYFT